MQCSWQSHAAALASWRTRLHLCSCWNTAAQPSQPTLQLWLRTLSLSPPLLPPPQMPLPRALRMQRQLSQPAAAAAVPVLLLGSAAQHPHSSMRLQRAHHHMQQAVQCQLGIIRSYWSLHFFSSCWGPSGNQAGRPQ